MIKPNYTFCFRFCLIGVFLLLTGLNQAEAQVNAPIEINENIRLLHINDSVFIHESWHESPTFGRFPSNGMLIIRKGKAIMVDTPMDEAKTGELLDYLAREMGVEVELFIAGHYHDDCIGGIGRIHREGIPSLGSELTVAKCRELQLVAPQVSFSDSTDLDFYGSPVVCMYPGPGHSIDNIVVWLPESSILFGGCLVRSLESRGPGNLQDAFPGEWLKTLTLLQNKYRDARVVIPGHGRAGDSSLIDHSITILRDLVMNEKQ